MSRELRLSELASVLGGTWEGDGDLVVTGAASLGEAGPADVSFFEDERYRADLRTTRAGAVLAKSGVEAPVPVLRVERPYEAFTAVLARFAPARGELFPAGVHPTAVVDPTAELAPGVAVGPFSVVGAGVRIGAGTALGAHVVVGREVAIGADCLLYPQVTVREGCRIGDRCILHAGAVLGSDGFGFVHGPGGPRKVPQIGIVVLEDDVEIGANSCVDRATTGRTVIGAGTKVDNQVQIAHNVRIGRGCAISAQTGFAGSVTVGDGVIFGGQVGVADHLVIGDGAILAAKSGISKNVPAGETVFWYPALEISKARRLVALVRKLPEMARRLAELELRLGGSNDAREE
jgi:UDP-3-O-[3-hydroxymyristoyl] glucosamine N-acyltransferase